MESQEIKPSSFEVRYRPQDPDHPVIVTQEVKGRRLLIKATKRPDGVIAVEFMNQTFYITDEDYQRFLPEALKAAINKLSQVEK